MSIRPATFGPYKAREDFTVSTYRGEVLARCSCAADAAFVAHAASNYTILAAMLQDLIVNTDSQSYLATMARGRTMLESLGELRTY